MLSSIESDRHFSMGECRLTSQLIDLFCAVIAHDQTGFAFNTQANTTTSTSPCLRITLTPTLLG